MINEDIYSEYNSTLEYKDFPEEKGERVSNPDGTELKETVDKAQTHEILPSLISNYDPSLLNIYDPNNPDRQLFDLIEQELINLSSSPIKYYKLIKIKEAVGLYGEENVRKEYLKHKIIYGIYEQPVPAFIAEKFGARTGEEIEIKFNVNYLLNTIGDQMVHEGDILVTYDGKKWEVVTSTISDETLYRVQHNIVRALRLQTEGIVLPD